MSHSCFIHSSTDGHLGCFHILVIVNNIAMNIGLLMFFQISVLVSFGYISRSGIAGAKGRSIFIYLFLFLKLFYCCSITVVCIFSPPLYPTPAHFYFFEWSPYFFPQWLHPSAHLPTVQKCSPSSTSSPALALCCCIDGSHSDRCEVISDCGFNLCFSDD